MRGRWIALLKIGSPILGVATLVMIVGMAVFFALAGSDAVPVAALSIIPVIGSVVSWITFAIVKCKEKERLDRPLIQEEEETFREELVYKMHEWFHKHGGGIKPNPEDRENFQSAAAQFCGLKSDLNNCQWCSIPKNKRDPSSAKDGDS